VIFGLGRKTSMVSREDALRGRDRRPFEVDPTHVVLGTPIDGPWPEGSQVIYLAMGCFWGVERIFWRQPGVVATAVGYMGGYTPNPTYEETCTGLTGHAETVRVVYDPEQTSAELLLKEFWRTTTRRRRTGRATTSAPPTVRRSTGPPRTRSGP
jgi:peptide-methionine (S)-S-oxide reductase